jgi:hypothetical protein
MGLINIGKIVGLELTIDMDHRRASVDVVMNLQFPLKGISSRCERLTVKGGLSCNG